MSIFLFALLFLIFHTSAGEDKSVADQKIECEINPSINSSWNVEEAEGNLEFGDDGLVTAKDSYGLIRALESLPSKEHGIVYFELKIINFPAGCNLQLGISQKMMAMSSFYVFKPAFSYKNNWGHFHKGDVGSCGVKFGAGKMFIAWNARWKETVKLTDLKCGNGVDQKLTIKLDVPQIGWEECSVQLGRIAMSDDEGECPF